MERGKEPVIRGEEILHLPECLLSLKKRGRHSAVKAWGFSQIPTLVSCLNIVSVVISSTGVLVLVLSCTQATSPGPATSGQVSQKLPSETRESPTLLSNNCKEGRV